MLKTTPTPRARTRIGARPPPNATFTPRPPAAASDPATRGILVTFQRSNQVIPVPSLDQALIGIMISIIATEYPRATPVGPWLSPRRTPTITTGVVAAVMPTARPTRPVAIINQESGFANAKTKDVGASNWKIGTTSIHL